MLLADDTSSPATADLGRAVLDAVRRVVGTSEAITLHEPEFRGQEGVYVLDCIETGWVSSVGAYVDRFEAMLAERCGTAAAVATVNGTAALHVALLLAGVKRGDEVLLPTLTFVATANAVRYADATPHFVDSEAATFGMDVTALRRHLEATAQVTNGVCVNKRTGAVIRAVVPMHVFGLASDLDTLLPLATEWGIAVVEDAAEALGSYKDEGHLGGFGLLGTLSFNGNKVITTGGGGAIVTNDFELGRRAKHLTTTARLRHRWEFRHDEVGFNYRLPNINAALGCAQLERLDDMLARKRQLAEAYQREFAALPGVTMVREPTGSRSNYWLNAMLLDRPDTNARDAVLETLNEDGVMARPVWTLMHRLPMFADCPRMDLRCAEDLEKRIINLPSSPKLANR